jgi:hypothetical protein
MIPDILDLYKSENNKDKLRKEAFSYFNDKYFKTPYTEYFFIEQTERFKARKLKFFIPGRIYTFQYNPHGGDILSYYDKRPMIYVIGEYVSTSTGYNIVQGINLNFLPEKAKVNFLSTALSVFKNAYVEGDKMSDANKISTMQGIQQLVTDWNFMEMNFDSRAKIGLNFATRNYDLSRIIQPVLIELEDFPMVPYFIPREFAGQSPGYVYQLYLKARQSLLKKPVTLAAKAKKIQKKFKRPGSA